MKDPAKVEADLELAITTLADIAFSDDLSLPSIRVKAKRIYRALRAEELQKEESMRLKNENPE